MKQIFFLLVALFLVRNASGDAPRVVDLKTPDGIILKGTYFAAAKPGPGVLLFHQNNRTRKSWDELAAQLAAAGIHVLTFDARAHGESGGKYDNEANRSAYWKTWWPSDLDTAFQYLSSQQGVNREAIGAGGAGNLGVESAIEAARRHPAQVKSLVLISGETDRSGMEFLHQASQLPELYVMDDNDEYPPTQEEMKLLYVAASSPMKKLVHYSQIEDAPWLWYETFIDSGKVPAKGGHGTDMFKVHPELPGIIVDWFVTTLIKTPGHAPADTVACAPVINQIQMPGGVHEVTKQLIEARRKDPGAQLFPEITVSTIGQNHMRGGDPKSAVEVFKLVLLAYPESADANETLAEAYLADVQKDMARQHAEKALALLDSHKLPASSWTDTEQYRGEIRRGAEKILKQLAPNHN